MKSPAAAVVAASVLLSCARESHLDGGSFDTPTGMPRAAFARVGTVVAAAGGAHLDLYRQLPAPFLHPKSGAGLPLVLGPRGPGLIAVNASSFVVFADYSDLLFGCDRNGSSNHLCRNLRLADRASAAARGPAGGDDASCVYGLYANDSSLVEETCSVRAHDGPGAFRPGADAVTVSGDMPHLLGLLEGMSDADLADLGRGLEVPLRRREPLPADRQGAGEELAAAPVAAAAAEPDVAEPAADFNSAVVAVDGAFVAMVGVAVVLLGHLWATARGTVLAAGGLAGLLPAAYFDLVALMDLATLMDLDLATLVALLNQINQQNAANGG